MRMVHVSLVNDQPRPSGTPDVARLYQAGLMVTALDGASAIFVGHNDPELSAPPAVHDGERLRLAMLHRTTRKYSTGAQCAVDADVRAGETRALANNKASAISPMANRKATAGAGNRAGRWSTPPSVWANWRLEIGSGETKFTAPWSDGV